MPDRSPSRRTLLQGALVAVAAPAPWLVPAPAVAQARRLPPTPAQSEGPYYPQQLPGDIDADLRRFGAAAEPAQGTPALVSGRVVDTAGRPIAGARVEIWQCDANGRYHHVAREAGSRPRDANFQGFGRMTTDAAGRYAFRTIRPVRYPGRAPHIHFNVVAANRRRLITQLYVEGDPGNDSDFGVRSLRTAEARAALVRPFLAAPDAGLGPQALAATFDIVLAG